MREVNFSIPNVNKASVGITAALYDRRALDCTSTLPLINSLNHLAYLTTSSARIRDILTVDGGIERLVCILKEGRSKEMMETWKWNLAFQCVVNIGVRGSEAVRTRVVEADMVPVIATILDNYVRVTEKIREDKDTESRRTTHRSSPPRPVVRLAAENGSRGTVPERSNGLMDHRSIRRQAPPSIEIPQPYTQQTQQQQIADGSMEVTPTLPLLALTSPQESNPVRPHHHHHHHHHRHHHTRSQQDVRTLQSRHGNGFQSGSVLSLDVADGFGLRSVRDAERLPSTLPALQNGITSQPESPTTPNAPIPHSLNVSVRAPRRPTLRAQNSNSGDSDDGGNEIPPAHTTATVVNGDEPMVDIQATVGLDGPDDRTTMIETVPSALDLSDRAVADGPEIEAFNITHRPGSDGSIITTAIPTTAEAPETLGLRPPPPPLQPISNPVANTRPGHQYLLERNTQPGMLAASPRDEDVLMSLQLLAYVSKYCNLRTYFQQSHLVPKLRIDNPMYHSEAGIPSSAEVANQEEYTLPDDYNIFPLVEKFTVRHNSQDMQYWAGVVMRNLCRKDDSRGGIRQCAYYRCGKWEEWTRQFAKCRRCRRTKYCSKECQKNAWVYHRHWCQVANP
jgi:hypothetical protein